MTSIRMGSAALLFVLLLGGCATVQTDQEWGKVRGLTVERIEEDIIWEQSEREALTIQQEIGRLLADGLSRQEAVQIALINNRKLQSAFENLGIFKSDLVQAGLFTNPSLEALFRFPSGGGRTNVEAGILFSLSDLWQIPYRKKVATARMEATVLWVGQVVLNTAAEAKRAYDTLSYTSKSTKETDEILQRFRAIEDQTVRRRDFGFMTDQDVYLAGLMVAEAEIEVARFASEAAIARAHLNRVLGLGPSQGDYQLLEEPSEEPSHIPQLQEALTLAMENRLDIQVARFEVRQAESGLQLEKRRILKHVGVGGSYEGDTDGTDLLGPAIDIQVPLFDQNQAGIARAEYRVRKARKNLQAAEAQVHEEVFRDLERIHFLQTRAQQLREKIIPHRERILGYAEEWVNAMQLNRLYLLEAQKGLLQSRREYLNTQMELQRALADLELHLGGRLPQ